MIERILPQGVTAVEARGDAAGGMLFPEERAALGKAVQKRRREFATARTCAREAFARLGAPRVAVRAGEHGEPQWPAGLVGSITHCDGYRACAVGRSKDVASVGIDAEPNAPLPDGVLGEVARPEELPWLSRLGRDEPAVHWDRVLFSAKESVYKAWYPLVKRRLGFEDAILTVHPREGTFHARLLSPGPVLNGLPLTGLAGRWLVRDELVMTAVALTRTARAGAGAR